jgi:uncharacterized protein (TIGR03032 family)
MSRAQSDLDTMWARYSGEWRDQAQIASQWREAALVKPSILRSRARGDWWGILEASGLTLFVTREYEHLVVALCVEKGSPRVSFFPVPHPSGLVVDRDRQRVFIASTRNPNQVFVLKPVHGLLQRRDIRSRSNASSVMVPVSSSYYPGSLYLHDLALYGQRLFGNAVGHNAVTELRADGGFAYEWWPKCVEVKGRPVRSCNFIQMNSIAAGKTLQESFFSASSAVMGRRRPGHLDFPVDRRGVIFSGRTREPICTGLTRPHSARLADGKIWVANSGYGEFGYVSGNALEVVRRLPGWTRGLCLVDDMAFVATSRVIPRFARYAPGLEVSKSCCAIYAISQKTGALLGSLEWPEGNQVFAIDWIRSNVSPGFAFAAPYRQHTRELDLFYAYLTNSQEQHE